MEYKCQYCNKIFSQKSNLNTHIRTAKKCIATREIKEEIQSFNCESCNKSFTTKLSLNYHKKICLISKLEYSSKLKELEDLIIEKDF